MKMGRVRQKLRRMARVPEGGWKPREVYRREVVSTKFVSCSARAETAAFVRPASEASVRARENCCEGEDKRTPRLCLRNDNSVKLRNGNFVEADTLETVRDFLDDP
jgi:hypothetical protein